MKYKKLFFIFLVIAVLPVVVVQFFSYKIKSKAPIYTENLQIAEISIEADDVSDISQTNIKKEVVEKAPALQETLETQEVAKMQEVILYDVPFTPQAPSGNWDDIRQQNACEEASVLMAMRWVQSRGLTLDEAEKEIIKISDFELKNYGHFHDTSAKDTVIRIFEDYFNYSNVELKINANVENIKEELYKGNLVIAPMNGQKLDNPFYTPPGPLEHMLVIKGYDKKTNEFITNDPGTKRGESIRYSVDNFYESMQDYPTGFHEPITETNKVIIVVRPNL